MTEQELIKELNSFCKYNPETGSLVFTKRRKYTQDIIGQQLGGLNADGYLRVQVCGFKHFVHRLIWLLYTGHWPKYEIDHRDGDIINNRIDNLRDVLPVINRLNQNKRSDNTSGTTGVYLHKRINKWQASIGVSGKLIHLGYFDDFNKAVAARCIAEAKYGFSERHGI